MAGDLRVLGFAAASGRVGFVLLSRGDVELLGMSRKASIGPAEASGYAAQRIEELRPDVIVTEKVVASSKKGGTTRTVIAAITAVADLAEVMNMDVVRGRMHATRFDEARKLAERYPAMQPYLPKVRKPWEAEPKALIYFEAIALIESALGRQSADPTA